MYFFSIWIKWREKKTKFIFNLSVPFKDSWDLLTNARWICSKACHLQHINMLLKLRENYYGRKEGGSKPIEISQCGCWASAKNVVELREMQNIGNMWKKQHRRTHTHTHSRSHSTLLSREHNLRVLACNSLF